MFVVAPTMHSRRRPASIGDCQQRERPSMSTAEAQKDYALERTPDEYERLRAQARTWEAATGRLLDQIGLAPGASCLDAGCGPGETMRVMAQRVGPAGRVLGIDADASVGAAALAMLHRSGHRQCSFHTQDLAADEPIPGAPFDLVYARLLLFHLPDRVAALARLWDVVAPGGHLVVQDYDLRTVRLLPAIASADEAVRVMIGAFTAVGCDVHTGTRLPQLFAQAGIGNPDGIDVAGHLEPFASGHTILAHTFRSVLPAALAHGITTEESAATTLAGLEDDGIMYRDRPMLWPLLIGACKHKRQASPR
jgi:trans-aconitate methyltransferase